MKTMLSHPNLKGKMRKEGRKAVNYSSEWSLGYCTFRTQAATLASNAWRAVST